MTECQNGASANYVSHDRQNPVIEAGDLWIKIILSGYGVTQGRPSQMCNATTVLFWNHLQGQCKNSSQILPIWKSTDMSSQALLMVELYPDADIRSNQSGQCYPGNPNVVIIVPAQITES